MTVLSVFGASPPPGTYAVFTDGGGIRLGQRFYRVAPFSDAGQIVGGRVWIPATVPGATGLRIMLFLAGAPITGAPAQSVTVPLSGVGYHEGTFPAATAVPAVGQPWTIAYEFVGNLNAYVYTSNLRQDLNNRPLSPQANNLWLSEVKSLFRIGAGAESSPVSYAVAYGIDTLVDDGVVIAPPNVPPVAQAGADQTVASGGPVVLSGASSTDPDGTLAAYVWEQLTGPTVTLGGTGASRTFTAPVGPASLSFRLTVTDDDGATSADDVVVSVGPPPNVPPIARAGADQAVASEAVVTLSGATSTDADGSVASYAWAQTAGPAVILNGTGFGRTFTAPEGPASLTFTLTTTDDDGAASVDSVVVTVAAPVVAPPAASSSLLTDEDLAFMRETQAEARPTAAELIRVTQGPTASGGRGNVRADPEPIQVRLDGQEKRVPNVVAAVIGSAKAVKVTMDMVEVGVGDIVRVDGEEYQVITGADPDRWATAQIVWTKRVKGG